MRIDIVKSAIFRETNDLLILIVFNRFMLDNWERRHGIWKLFKHSIPDTTNVPPTSSSSSHNVIIKFMHDTLELNLTLGHQITPDTVPKNETEERGINLLRKTKTTFKVLHWTLLKIEFTNPSKAMLKHRKRNKNVNENGTENGDDVRLAHYLLLRNLTPSRLADMCPNTKSLEKTLAIISQVIRQYGNLVSKAMGYIQILLELC